MRTRHLTFIAATAAAGALLAGCGGGSGNAKDATSGLTAAQILQRSVTAATALKSFTVDLTEVITPTTKGTITGPAGISLSNKTTLTAKGPVVLPDRLQLDVGADVGLPIQATLTRVGGKLFLGIIGQDYALNVNPSTVNAISAGRIFPAVASWISNPKIDGRETMNGQQSVRLVGDVNAKAVTDSLMALLAANPLGGVVKVDPAQVKTIAAKLAPQFANDHITVWVRTNDLRPTRLSAPLTIEDGTSLSPKLTALSSDLTLNMTGFDGSFSVNAPAGAKPLNLSDLTRLAGG